jgi:TatD family-associated radical SAM protein
MEGIDGYDLWLRWEPEARDITQLLKGYDLKKYKDVVFCGYGEPTMKLNVLLEVAHWIKQNHPNVKTRINTNGQANLYHKKDVTPRLNGLIDRLSISLNAPTAKEYQEICHSEFGEDAFYGVLEFARLAKRHVLGVRVTVVDVIGDEKIKKCRKLADENGLELYVRHSA